MSPAKEQYDYYVNVRTRKVDWLWYPYIPYGKITVLQGDPGEGKSTFLLNLAAIVSVGGQLSTGEQFKEPQSVIYQCAEDSLADTIKPRLEAACADCSRIAYILDEDSSLTLDDERIRDTAMATGARLVIIDPIQAYIPPDADMQSAAKMRNVLRGLAQVAEELHCAIVLVGHMNKDVGAKTLYRSLGSIDIVAIARSVLMITRDEFDPSIRYMYPLKTSLAPAGRAVGFCLSENNGFLWLGRFNCEASTSENLLFSPRHKKETAMKILENMLCVGDMPAAKVLEKLARLGIRKRTANTAKAEMGIKTYMQGSTWYWHLGCLPGSTSEDVTE